MISRGRSDALLAAMRAVLDEVNPTATEIAVVLSAIVAKCAIVCGMSREKFLYNCGETYDLQRGGPAPYAESN